MTILEKIISSKTKELKILKSLNSIKDLENKKLFEKQTFSLKERLELSRHGIIAEHKRKSPSKSIINDNVKLKNVIISLGGGAFINKSIRKEVLKNHISFWLNWNEKTLFNRIKNSKKRPLVINKMDNELIDLIKKRSYIYSKALNEIKCDNLSKNEIVRKILKIYETYQVNH